MSGVSPETSSPEVIETRALELRDTVESLRRHDREALGELVAAVQQFSGDPLLVSALVRSTGLSEPVVQLGLSTSFETFTLSRLLGLRAVSGFERNSTRLAAVVLAGNVFTAAARALLVPLVLGVPVLAKASSRESIFPLALSAALPAVFAKSLHVCVFPGGSPAQERALFRYADVVHAYGGDATLLQLRGHAPAGALFVPHGHGLGVAYVDDFTRDDVEGMAQDMVAYDQRGCLSPVEVLVKGGHAEARLFAEALHGALCELDVSLPRGTLGPAEGAARAQWRGVAMAAGQLFESADHAVALEGETALPRAPGGRSLLVRCCKGRADAEARWSPHGRALKAIGVSRACLARGEFPKPRGTAARVSKLGEMQRPAFDAMADGRPVHEGLIWRMEG